MNEHTTIEHLLWRESHAAGEGAAVGHAWIEFEIGESAVLVKVNRLDALRISIKYRETGPYIAVEKCIANYTRETMGDCTRAARMAERYGDILDAHNALGDLLVSARSFIVTDEEKDRAAAYRDAQSASVRGDAP